MDEALAVLSTIDTEAALYELTCFQLQNSKTGMFCGQKPIRVPVFLSKKEVQMGPE